MTDSKLKLNANKTEFLIIGKQKQHGKCDCFFLTPRLSQNFTLAVSARNFGVTFDINFSDSIFHKLVIATFITFVTFVVFTGICLLLLPKLLQLLLLAVDLTIAIPFIILLSRTSYKDILKLQRVQNCLARVVTQSPHFCHSAPLLKSLHLYCTTTYQALSSKQPVYLHSQLLQNSPDSFDHLIVIYFLFLMLRQMSELEFFSCCTDSVELTPVSVKEI